MAKAAPKNKSPKKASSIFHNIMAASVSGNPKPKKENKKEQSETYDTLLNRSVDVILEQANVILTLDPDPSISDEDKKIMFDKTNEKMEAALKAIEDAKNRLH